MVAIGYSINLVCWVRSTSLFLLYMWADCTHRPSFLVLVLAHVTSFAYTGHRVLSVCTLPHSLGSLLFRPIGHIGEQPDV
jgi:hypothetical protein